MKALSPDVLYVNKGYQNTLSGLEIDKRLGGSMLEMQANKIRALNSMRNKLRKFQLKINKDKSIDNEIIVKECSFGIMTLSC